MRDATALTLAGSDPTGGAGLQLDLQVFACHGVHGMAVPTALTVQTTERVHSVAPAFPTLVGEQLARLLEDTKPAAVKLGMLATDDVVLRVADVLERFPIPRVVDPVLRATDGTALLEPRALRNLCGRLISGALLVTPNRHEAEVLVGTGEAEPAAERFLEMGAAAVLIKGGHAEGAPDDYLLDDTGGRWLRGERRPGPPVHGTGCALSSAIVARLARGEALSEAVHGAKQWVAGAIADAHALGRGQRVLGLSRA